MSSEEYGILTEFILVSPHILQSFTEFALFSKETVFSKEVVSVGIVEYRFYDRLRGGYEYHFNSEESSLKFQMKYL